LEGNTKKEARKTVDVQRLVRSDSIEPGPFSKVKSSIKSKLTLLRHTSISVAAFQLSSKEAKVYVLEVLELNDVLDD